MPSGVKRYGHKSMEDTGKFHPDDIASGLETVDKLGGSPPPAQSAGSGSNSPPRGVVRGDGTENMEAGGSKKRGSIPSAPGSGSNHIPGDVRKHSGLKAPRSGRQP